MENCLHIRGRQLKHCTFIVSAARTGCAVKVSIRVQRQTRTGIDAVRPIVAEAIKNRYFTRRCDLKHRSAAGGKAVRAAILCGTVEIAVGSMTRAPSGLAPSPAP